MSGTPPHLYPAIIVEDRYTGIYSGGEWLAVAMADQSYKSQSRAHFVISEDGPHGDDGTALDFWANPPDWIAVGDTPQEALDNLIRGIKPRPYPLGE